MINGSYATTAKFGGYLQLCKLYHVNNCTLMWANLLLIADGTLPRSPFMYQYRNDKGPIGRNKFHKTSPIMSHKQEADH